MLGDRGANRLSPPLPVHNRYVFQTEAGTPFIFTGTGTGGWESALTNTLSPGACPLAHHSRACLLSVFLSVYPS